MFEQGKEPYIIGEKIATYIKTCVQTEEKAFMRVSLFQK